MADTSLAVAIDDSAEVNVDNFAFAAPGARKRSETTGSSRIFLPMTKSLRDELVRLYFRHAHPLCPVVDEFSFCDTYFAASTEDELFQQTPPVIFYAMVFLAFTHIDQYWLRHSQYETVAQGQKILVKEAKANTLRATRTRRPLHTDAGRALLSFWSPYDTDDQVNSFWVREAFYHANKARLGVPNRGSGTLSSRQLVIWWCCLTRDRLTTCGLRRPQELQDTDSTCPMPEIADFGFEAIFPRFIDVGAKHILLKSFIWLCKLSEITKSIIGVTHEISRGSAGNSSLDGAMEKSQVIVEQLQTWTASYQTQVQEEASRVTSRYNRMPMRILKIIAVSLTVSLYAALVQIPSCQNVARGSRAVALLQIRDAAVRVNHNVETAMQSARVEDLPQWLVAWIILPIVCLEVRSYIHGTPHVDQSEQMTGLRTMLSSLHSRFGGVKYVANMIRQIQSMMSEYYRLKTATSELSSGPIGIEEPADTGEAELEMLDFAIRLVDLNLASRPTL